MNNEKEKTLKVEVKPSVENIVKKLAPEQEAHIDENKIFYVKDYPNSDECYKAASTYVLSAGIDCTIEPIFEADNVIRNPEDIIGYEVKLK